MAEGRTKRAVRDYGGMAALVTATASAIALFVNQSGAQESSEKVQASMLAVMQYRLSVVEAACGVGLRPQPASAPATVPVPVPAPVAVAPAPLEPTEEAGSEAAEEAFEGATEMVAEAAPMDAPPPPPEEPRKALRRKFKAKRNLDLKDIQDYVQKSGKALSAEDL